MQRGSRGKAFKWSREKLNWREEKMAETKTHRCKEGRGINGIANEKQKSHN